MALGMVEGLDVGFGISTRFLRGTLLPFLFWGSLIKAE